MSDNWTAGGMQDRFYEVTANLSMVGEKPAYSYRNHPFISPGAARVSPITRTCLCQEWGECNYFTIKKIVRNTKDFEQNYSHWHDFVEFWYVLEGRYNQYFGGEKYELGPGSLFLIPPFNEHRITIPEKEQVTFICGDISLEFVKGLALDAKSRIPFLRTVLFSGRPYQVFTGEKRESADRLFQKVCDEYTGNPKKFITVKRQEISGLFRFCFSSSEYTDCELALFKQPYLATARTAIKYINEHYREKIFHSDLSRVTMFSNTHFSRIFKWATGNTYTEYLLILRVLKAAQDLIYTDIPIQDIAARHGFDSRTLFCKQFKFFLGMTPKEHRALYSNR